MRVTPVGEVYAIQALAKPGVTLGIILVPGNVDIALGIKGRQGNWLQHTSTYVDAIYGPTPPCIVSRAGQMANIELPDLCCVGVAVYRLCSECPFWHCMVLRTPGSDRAAVLWGIVKSVASDLATQRRIMCHGELQRGLSRLEVFAFTCWWQPRQAL